MEKIRAGVIGLGVGLQHAEALAANPYCELVSICDLNPEKLDQAAVQFPYARPTLHDKEILSERSIDLVCIASYDDCHFEQTMQALECGKHVFVEKPFVLCEEEAKAVRDELRRRPGTRLSSNLILRMSPRFLDLRNRIDEGQFGQLFCLEADYNFGRLKKITEGWRGKLPFYSVVYGGGVHVVDLLMWLARDRVTEVSATGNAIASQESGFQNYDMVVSWAKFLNGAVGKFGVNFGCVMPHFHNVTVYGTKATFINGAECGYLYKSRNVDASPIFLNTAYPGVHKGALLSNFVDAILGRGVAEVTEEDVFASLSVCFAIERSARTGWPVKVSYI